MTQTAQTLRTGAILAAVGFAGCVATLPLIHSCRPAAPMEIREHFRGAPTTTAPSRESAADIIEEARRAGIELTTQDIDPASR